MKTFDPSLGDLWFASSQQAAFSPVAGKVDYSAEEVAAHNRQLSELRLQAMKETGRACLYLTKSAEGWQVTDFEGRIRIPAGRVKKSYNNWGAQRLDAWFAFDGSVWHGVCVGDNEILRCRRTLQATASK